MVPPTPGAAKGNSSQRPPVSLCKGSMYPLDLIALGRLRLDPCRDLAQHYLDMLRPYARVEVTELAGGKGDPAKALKEEATRIRARIQGVTCPVLLTPEGKLRD